MWSRPQSKKRERYRDGARLAAGFDDQQITNNLAVNHTKKLVVVKINFIII